MNLVWLAFTILAALLGIMLSAKAVDPGMMIHGMLFSIAAVISAYALISRHYRSVNEPILTSGSGSVNYNIDIIKAGVIASSFWGVVGFSVGLVIALQLAFPVLNFDLPWTNFGRLRPLHTSAVVFAFGGNILIMTSFHAVQRTCRARLAGDLAPWFVFWGYQLFIVLAATGYVLGITQSKEYAEPEWYVDIWLTIVWVAYLLVFLATLWKRKEKHIYVANWFFLAFIVTVAMLHIVNNLSMPVSFTGVKSYSLFAGVQSALTQWWYGHNAVGFFLTAGFLGIMYYFIPKRVNRPVYS
ncbi:MAG: peptidase S41, partial [Sneathiella sp.]